MLKGRLNVQHNTGTLIHVLRNFRDSQGCEERKNH